MVRNFPEKLLIVVWWTTRVRHNGARSITQDECTNLYAIGRRAMGSKSEARNFGISYSTGSFDSTDATCVKHDAHALKHFDTEYTIVFGRTGR